MDAAWQGDRPAAIDAAGEGPDQRPGRRGRGKQHRHQPDTHRRQRAQNHPPASPKRKT